MSDYYTKAAEAYCEGDETLDLVAASKAPDQARRFRAAVDQARAGIDKALEMAFRYGGIDGGHHKAWVIDQMVRALTGDGYDAWITDYREGEDGPETYTWDTGIAP